MDEVWCAYVASMLPELGGRGAHADGTVDKMNPKWSRSSSGSSSGKGKGSSSGSGSASISTSNSSSSSSTRLQKNGAALSASTMDKDASSSLHPSSTSSSSSSLLGLLSHSTLDSWRMPKPANQNRRALLANQNSTPSSSSLAAVAADGRRACVVIDSAVAVKLPHGGHA